MATAFAVLLGLLVLIAPQAVWAGASNASNWSVSHYSRTRLVSGATLGEDGAMKQVAGIEIQLADGWKTYWRTASGSGGFPPVFNWQGSRNVREVHVLFPAPQRFVERGETTIGYKQQVVFPLEVTAVDPKRPVALKLQMDFGVCTDICVPVEADLALNLETDLRGAGLAPLITRYLERVPRPLDTPAGSEQSRPIVEKLQLSGVDEKSSLLVAAKFPGAAEAADLFIEAADGSFVPPAQVLENDGNGRIVFGVQLASRAQLDAVKNSELILTLVSANGQSETRMRVQ